ncbi:MAG TPA: hypothetical protein PK988_08680 [Candidatus Sumerlaeota bacterium]|nr:hypothetical protein [Candidatus Sumerlaeota bacterium]
MTPQATVKPRPLLVPATLVALIIVVIVWTMLTAHLAVMSRHGLNQIENFFREFLISRKILSPEWKHYQPPAWDLLQHVLFYAPYGLFAGALGSLMRSWRGPIHARIAEVVGLGFGFGAALFDELRQSGMVDRRPGFDDLFSGWAGIAIAFACYLLIAQLWRRRQLRLASMQNVNSTK